MTLISINGTRNKFSAKRKKVVASLLSSEDVTDFPTTGAGIEGLGDNYDLLPGSTIYVVSDSKLYMADEEMNWVEQ